MTTADPHALVEEAAALAQRLAKWLADAKPILRAWDRHYRRVRACGCDDCAAYLRRERAIEASDRRYDEERGK